VARSERREEREAVGPAGAAHGELGVLAVEGLAELPVAVEQEAAETEDLDLLRVLVVGEHVLEVIEAARVRRAPVAQAEGGGAELDLGDGGRDGRGDEAEHDPAAVAGDEDDVTGEGDGVLDDLEGVEDDRDGARRGLAAGAREAIVDLGILEVGELEGEGLLEDLDVDVEAEAGAEHGAHEAEAAHGAGGEGDEDGFDDDPAEGDGAVLREDGIDDELGDLRHGERQERGGEGQEAERQGAGAGGAPDEADGARDMREAGAQSGAKGQGRRRNRLRWSCHFGEGF
jgi:hypothetical protein